MADEQRHEADSGVEHLSCSPAGFSETPDVPIDLDRALAVFCELRVHLAQVAAKMPTSDPAT